MEPESPEAALFDEVSRLGATLWDETLNVVALSTDPKMLSGMFYKRLWSNHRGYALLHKNHFNLEAEIVLRSAVEAAICIAANFYLRDELVVLIRQDAAFSIQGQLKLDREDGDLEGVKEAQDTINALQLPDGRKPAKLDWKWLAKQGKVAPLYQYHRILSAGSSHVTGISVLRDVVAAGEPRVDEEMRLLSRRMHLVMMAAATLQGSMVHAGMIGADDLVRRAHELLPRLNELSKIVEG